jgi:pimeloyl-ACP methyl ester carboxylesterase
MAVFVLVHGAWGGAGVWRNFAPLLRDRGHEVFYFSLTGLGERYHLGQPQTDLSTHIQDVLELIEYENLTDIVLAGHSYGGMVITGVADRIPESIAHVVYLDAFLPRDGQALVDMDGTRGGGGGVRFEMQEDGFRILPTMPPDAPRPQGLVPRGQPIETFQEAVKLSVPLEQRPFSRTYVKAGLGMMLGGPPGPRVGMFWEAAARTRDDPAWRYVELPAYHGLFTELPATVAGILLDLVNPPQPPLFSPPRSK